MTSDHFSLSDFRSLLESVPARTEGENAFHAIEFPGRSNDFLARDKDGRPLILLSQGRTIPRAIPVRLRNLSVQFNTGCRVKTAAADRAIEEPFVLIRCDSDDSTLFTIFLAAGAAMLSQMPQPATEAAVRGYVEAFVELFRQLHAPSGRSVAGLWAELLVIASAAEPDRWLNAWHRKSQAKHDFSFGEVKYEVKSSRTGARLHDFSLDQISLPTGSIGYVISVLLREDVGGSSLLDLADEVTRVAAKSPDAAMKLWSNISEVIGNDLGAVEDMRFDRRHAQDSIRAIPSELIPRPAIPDARVQQVRFCLDLATLADSGQNLPDALSLRCGRE